MAACGELLSAACRARLTDNEQVLDRFGCDRTLDGGRGAGDAIDYGRRSQVAAAERCNRRGPPRHSARTEGRDRLTSRRGPFAIAAPAEIRIFWRRDDQSRLGEGDLSSLAECGPDPAREALHSG